jgi:spore cortex formation protein SpoVR/YcgB (stage V sporulation)
MIRQFRLFRVLDDDTKDNLKVAAIHDERGYQDLRRAIGRAYDLSNADPDIFVDDVDLSGDRTLRLVHRVHNGVRLEEDDTRRTLRHLADLWGYDVALTEIDAETEAKLNAIQCPPRRPFGVA